MRTIEILDQKTIDKIAAGEVVERPSSVIKELAENAIDAKADAVAIELKDGGISMMRVTDDGVGIAPDEVRKAFLRHATSKIREVTDLQSIDSFGFRGEALSSIAAVSRVELITKRAEDLTASRYRIEGGREAGFEEIGAPDGTTIFVRGLFYNTPARAKFLKTAMTETAHAGTIVEQMALSNPGVSFKYIVNGETKLATSGNGELKDVIYQIFGRETAGELIPAEGSPDAAQKGIRITGYIAAPSVSRGNRNFENYYVNGRMVKNRILMKAIEDGFGKSLMQHQYPFTCLLLTIDGALVDVNVHPTKMEVRFSEEIEIYEAVKSAVSKALSNREMIVRATLEKKSDRLAAPAESVPEKTQTQSREKSSDAEESSDTKESKPVIRERKPDRQEAEPNPPEKAADKKRAEPKIREDAPSFRNIPEPFEKNARKEFLRREETTAPNFVQEEMPTGFLKEKAKAGRRILGQVFSTYWIAEYEQNLFIIDQHAAHEKVLYERLMREYQDRKVSVQSISPPMIVSLTMEEETLLGKASESFRSLGFEIEPFGDREVAVRGVPYQLSAMNSKALFLEMLDHLEDSQKIEDLDFYTHRVATEACKAAVKGNGRLSASEAEILIDELMTLDDPYHCPHGRPTIISLSRTELEKKFKRVL